MQSTHFIMFSSSQDLSNVHGGGGSPSPHASKSRQRQEFLPNIQSNLLFVIEVKGKENK